MKSSALSKSRLMEWVAIEVPLSLKRSSLNELQEASKYSIINNIMFPTKSNDDLKKTYSSQQNYQ